MPVGLSKFELDLQHKQHQYHLRQINSYCPEDIVGNTNDKGNDNRKRKKRRVLLKDRLDAEKIRNQNNIMIAKLLEIGSRNSKKVIRRVFSSELTKQCGRKRRLNKIQLNDQHWSSHLMGQQLDQEHRDDNNIDQDNKQQQPKYQCQQQPQQQQQQRIKQNLQQQLLSGPSPGSHQEWNQQLQSQQQFKQAVSIPPNFQRFPRQTQKAQQVARPRRQHKAIEYSRHSCSQNMRISSNQRRSLPISISISINSRNRSPSRQSQYRQQQQKLFQYPQQSQTRTILCKLTKIISFMQSVVVEISKMGRSRLLISGHLLGVQTTNKVQSILLSIQKSRQYIEEYHGRWQALAHRVTVNVSQDGTKRIRLMKRPKDNGIYSLPHASIISHNATDEVRLNKGSERQNRNLRDRYQQYQNSIEAEISSAAASANSSAWPSFRHYQRTHMQSKHNGGQNICSKEDFPPTIAQASLKKQNNFLQRNYYKLINHREEFVQRSREKEQYQAQLKRKSQNRAIAYSRGAVLDTVERLYRSKNYDTGEVVGDKVKDERTDRGRRRYLSQIEKLGEGIVFRSRDSREQQKQQIQQKRQNPPHNQILIDDQNNLIEKVKHVGQSKGTKTNKANNSLPATTITTTRTSMVPARTPRKEPGNRVACRRQFNTILTVGNNSIKDQPAHNGNLKHINGKEINSLNDKTKDKNNNDNKRANMVMSVNSRTNPVIGSSPKETNANVKEKQFRNKVQQSQSENQQQQQQPVALQKLQQHNKKQNEQNLDSSLSSCSAVFSGASQQQLDTLLKDNPNESGKAEKELLVHRVNKEQNIDKDKGISQNHKQQDHYANDNNADDINDIDPNAESYEDDYQDLIKEDLDAVDNYEEDDYEQSYQCQYQQQDHFQQQLNHHKQQQNDYRQQQGDFKQQQDDAQQSQQQIEQHQSQCKYEDEYQQLSEHIQSSLKQLSLKQPMEQVSQLHQQKQENQQYHNSLYKSDLVGDSANQNKSGKMQSSKYTHQYQYDSIQRHLNRLHCQSDEHCNDDVSKSDQKNRGKSSDNSRGISSEDSEDNDCLDVGGSYSRDDDFQFEASAQKKDADIGGQQQGFIVNSAVHNAHHTTQ